MSRRVLLAVVSPAAVRNGFVPEGSTFAALLEVDGELQRVLASDDDFPVSVHPEQFAQSLATAADARYVGLGRGLRFDMARGRWVGIDVLACHRHGLRDCEVCLEGHDDPLDSAGAGIEITGRLRTAPWGVAA